MDSPTTAILFFSYCAEQEARRKNWSDGNQSLNRNIAHSLISESLQILRHTGMPVFHYDEKLQRGNSFGERFANAFDEVFDMGFDAVIAVGNDCPALKNVNWDQVSQSLKDNTPVVGPSLRGGVYLLAIPRTCWNKAALLTVKWQTRHVLPDLMKLWSSMTRLQVARDLNSKADLYLFLKENVGSCLSWLLLLIPEYNYSIKDQGNPSNYNHTYWSLRAPPCAA